jgi:hypothetical protein
LNSYAVADWQFQPTEIYYEMDRISIILFFNLQMLTLSVIQKSTTQILNSRVSVTMDLKSLKQQRIGFPLSHNIVVLDGWIYYLNSNDNDRIYKIRTDKTEYAKLTDAKTRQFWIVDGWIYYSNWFDGRKVYKIRTDGT